MSAVTVRWSSWSFLVYAGALSLGLMGGVWFTYLASKTGPAGDVLWALLILAVLLAGAEAFRGTGHRVTAGALAFGAVAAFAVLVTQLFDWFGWAVADAIRGFSAPRLLFALAWAAAAAAALRRYRFPLIVAQLIYASFFFILDLVSGGGTWSAIVAIALGLAALAVAVALDATAQRPYAFWVHVGAGLMVGGGALYCVRHGGTVAWSLVVAAAIAFVWIARATQRSSWAVLGAIGVFIAATYFALRLTRISLFIFAGGHGTHAWAAPVVYSVAAALVLALGLWVSRRPEAG